MEKGFNICIWVYGLKFDLVIGFYVVSGVSFYMRSMVIYLMVFFLFDVLLFWVLEFIFGEVVSKFKVELVRLEDVIDEIWCVIFGSGVYYNEVGRLELDW